MAKQGRPTEVQLRRTRDLIERFHLSGFSAPRIREELLALRSDPIDLRVEQVRRHIASIRRDWAFERPEEVETTRRDLIGHCQSVMFEAARGAAAKRGTTIEIGQNKLRLDAAVQLAKLVGLDIKRVQVTGANGAPLLQLPPHPIDDFDRKELDKRARMWVEDIDAAEVENEPG